jgi:hypothetical protein
MSKTKLPTSKMSNITYNVYTLIDPILTAPPQGLPRCPQQVLGDKQVCTIKLGYVGAINDDYILMSKNSEVDILWVGNWEVDK